MRSRITVPLQWWLLGALAISLPFTSFPLTARLMGSGMVAPLAVLPLVVLLAVWLFPFFLQLGRLPSQMIPLLGFVMAVLVSMAAAFFIAIPPYRSVSHVFQTVEALLTLAIGVCFYLVLATWTRDRVRLVFILRWINWSGLLVLAWSFFQAYIWYRYKTYPDWMWHFQASVSTSALLYGSRVNGFAYEPSWLSHQLNMLYLPLWLSAAATGFSAHRWRLGRIHFEHLLLPAGFAVLVLSISRIGLLTFMMMLAYLILLLSVRLVRWLPARLLNSSPLSERRRALSRRWLTAASVILLLLVYAGLLFGAAYGLSKYDSRMQRFFDFSMLREYSFFHYANQLVFAERVVYWQAGWEVFNDYPILGVGLGNAGFFFPEKLSAFSWSLTEIRTLMYQWSSLPNIKSLWVRLLAETGVIGFALFASWCYVLWFSARFLRSNGEPLLKNIGLAGSFVLVGFLVEGFSVDTFALPYYWISFALLTAACEIARRQSASQAAADDQAAHRI